VASLLKTWEHLAATRGCSLETGQQAAGTSQRSSSTHSAPRVQLPRWAGSPPRLHYLRSMAEGLPGRLAVPGSGVIPACHATGNPPSSRKAKRWPPPSQLGTRFRSSPECAARSVANFGFAALVAAPPSAGVRRAFFGRKASR